MIIGKLGIRGRLNVLLLVALAAVLLVATPFVVGQADMNTLVYTPVIRAPCRGRRR